MKKNRYKLLLVILLTIIVILIILLLRSCGQHDQQHESKSLDYEPMNSQQEYIDIPTVTELRFDADSSVQHVNFTNPAKNNCYMKISLYLSDDTKIYESDLIKPDEHVTEITLDEKLKRGKYSNCNLKYEFFSLDDQSQLNGANVKISIIAL